MEEGKRIIRKREEEEKVVEEERERTFWTVELYDECNAIFSHISTFFVSKATELWNTNFCGQRMTAIRM